MTLSHLKPVNQIELAEFESWQTGDIFKDPAQELPVALIPAREEGTATTPGCDRSFRLRETKPILKQFHIVWVMMTLRTDFFSDFSSLFSLTGILGCFLPLTEGLLG